MCIRQFRGVPYELHILPNSYLTATVNCYGRACLANFYLIMPNLPNKVQNRGIRHVLGEFCLLAKSVFKVVISQTPKSNLKRA